MSELDPDALTVTLPCGHQTTLHEEVVLVPHRDGCPVCGAHYIARASHDGARLVVTVAAVAE